jgi:hypothetical protein
MIIKYDSIDLELKFKKIIELQEKNMKYMESLGVDPNILQDYRKIIAYLKTRTDTEIVAILGAKPGKRKPNIDRSPDYSDEALTNIDGAKIMSIINSPEVSRALLERLASRRFGVTKGALSMLGSRDALKDKLLTLLGHEGTHEAIARVVGGSRGLDPKKT